ncbi:MAG: signal peptidase I [Candidatus Paceibacterota bacterium]
MEPSKENFIQEVFKFSLIALLIVIPFRIYVAQPFVVSGASMSPTFETGQYLIIDQLSYRFDEPARLDVVIFRFPLEPSKFFIKRVIGLPGETIEIRGNHIFIRSDGDITKLDEIYVDADNLREGFLTVELKENEYFVLGDNRRASSDSRSWGPVEGELIVGKAFLRLLPLNEVGLYPGSL